ncbi:MAG: acVLRF1 family peptidyl-tRNA hydrolase [Nocardioidaceae bacterium]
MLVPVSRLDRWLANLASRHAGTVTMTVTDGALVATAPDGTSATLRLPFDRSYDGPADPESFASAARAPHRWGILLVRKGGFAMAVVEDGAVVAHKVGQRHVQGRTKAGGQSQQRFARRRENQARQAYEAAAGHAADLLAEVEALVCGGDRRAVDAVLTDPRLRHAARRRTAPWLAVPDPRRAVLDRAILDAASVRIDLTDPD